MTIDLILEELEKIKGMLNILVARPFKLVTPAGHLTAPEPKKDLVVTEKVIVKGGSTIPKKGTGKYEWFKVKGLEKVKVRACSNEGCPYFLKFSEEKGKYEHWKFDPNTGEGGFVQDNCDYFVPVVKG